MIRILFALFLFIPVSAFPFQNEPNGFRNIPWDSPIGKAAGLRTVGEPVGTVQRYMKMDETFSYEGLTLSDIHYVTDQDKFVGAELTYDCAQYKKMTEVLKKKYGTAKAATQKKRTLTWQGKVTTVTLGPSVVANAKKPAPNEEPPLCSLTYSSTPHLSKNVPQQKGK